MIKEIQENINWEQNKKLARASNRFQSLIKELNTRELPENVVSKINEHVDSIANYDNNPKKLARFINQTTTKILSLLQKELNIVPSQYYQTLWMGVGLAVFGVPFGIIWFVMLDNPAFISIGIPMGLPIGIAVGASLDKKAAKEGRQLEFNPNK